MSHVITKAAAIIQPASDDAEQPNGSFDVILSAESKDRDGDALKRDEWQLPLPDHVVFDTDHGMSVATTVGSGKPFIDDGGNLRVRGTYSSIPRGQEIRTLVNEEHIRTVSVAFLTKRDKKDAKPSRELLNGAFVAIPSNTDAVVLSSKALDAETELKRGARNNGNDAQHIQAAHDHTVMLGASCAGPEDSSGSEEGARGGKALRTNGSPDPDNLTSELTRKDADTEDQDDDPVSLASATDAALDEAMNLIASIDTTDLPAEVLQAFALVQAADVAIDELLEVLGITDPDEDATDDSDSEPADKAASDSDESAAVTARALQFAIECEALSYSDIEGMH